MVTRALQELPPPGFGHNLEHIGKTVECGTPEDEKREV